MPPTYCCALADLAHGLRVANDLRADKDILSRVRGDILDAVCPRDRAVLSLDRQELHLDVAACVHARTGMSRYGRVAGVHGVVTVDDGRAAVCWRGVRHC